MTQTTRIARVAALALLAGFALSAAAYADNTTCGTATILVPDGSTQSGTLASSSDHRWFRFVAKAGRSYSIMAEHRSGSDVGGTIFLTTPNTDCAGTGLPAGTTLVSAHSIEPVSYTTTGAGRWTLMTGNSNNFEAFFSLTGGAAGQDWSIRIEDTTLFSNWFYLGGDYNAYTLLRNTTSSSITYTMNWRNSAGTIVATQTATLAANGSAYKNARDFAAAVAAGSGTVEIAHTGTPDAILASTTVMSQATGLSFDAPFSRRGRR